MLRQVLGNEWRGWQGNERDMFWHCHCLNYGHIVTSSQTNTIITNATHTYETLSIANSILLFWTKLKCDCTFPPLLIKAAVCYFPIVLWEASIFSGVWVWVLTLTTSKPSTDSSQISYLVLSRVSGQETDRVVFFSAYVMQADQEKVKDRQHWVESQKKWKGPGWFLGYMVSQCKI